jgi:hypothetical protein
MHSRPSSRKRVKTFQRLRLTPAQLSMLCEGIDWRVPVRTDAAIRAG